MGFCISVCVCVCVCVLLWGGRLDNVHIYDGIRRERKRKKERKKERERERVCVCVCMLRKEKWENNRQKLRISINTQKTAYVHALDRSALQEWTSRQCLWPTCVELFLHQYSFRSLLSFLPPQESMRRFHLVARLLKLPGMMHGLPPHRMRDQIVVHHLFH